VTDGSASPLPRRKAVWYWLPVLVWVGVMLYFSSAPDPYAAVGVQGTTLSDMLGHLCGFVVLAMLVLRWLSARQGGHGRRALAWTVVLCVAYALLDEVHQIPIPGRTFDWVDLGMDSLGAAIGTAVVSAYWAVRGGGK
jgi:VanZ family protein